MVLKDKKDLETKDLRPKHCAECTNFGISKLTRGMSRCKLNYLWFECGGKLGDKRKDPIPKDKEGFYIVPRE